MGYRRASRSRERDVPLHSIVNLVTFTLSKRRVVTSLVSMRPIKSPSRESRYSPYVKISPSRIAHSGAEGPKLCRHCENTIKGTTTQTGDGTNTCTRRTRLGRGRRSQSAGICAARHSESTHGVRVPDRRAWCMGWDAVLQVFPVGVGGMGAHAVAPYSLLRHCRRTKSNTTTMIVLVC